MPKESQQLLVRHIFQLSQVRAVSNRGCRAGSSRIGATTAVPTAGHGSRREDLGALGNMAADKQTALYTGRPTSKRPRPPDQGILPWCRPRASRDSSKVQRAHSAPGPRVRCRWGASLENSETEPNTRHGPTRPQTENLKHAYAGTTLDRRRLRDEGHEPDELNEARLALVDTACTSCLHSRAWREAYQQTLPTGLDCKATTNQKTFHFANGQSSDGRLQVWSIPVFLGGIRGEIHSAEMPDGTTPMLLSTLLRKWRPICLLLRGGPMPTAMPRPSLRPSCCLCGRARRRP